MGTASATWTRESIQWPKAVSARPSARHTNQAGKKDPRISKEGARPQPVQTVSASIDPRVEGRPSEFVIMAGSFWRQGGYFLAPGAPTCRKGSGGGFSRGIY